MVVWSGLCRGLGQIFVRKKPITLDPNVRNGQVIRYMSGGHHREFQITSSSFQWDKTKDLVLSYALGMAVPIAICITLINMYVGPAQLAPIPEGYVPKEWEYCRHPITQFIAKYLITSEQQEYEKNLCGLWWADEDRKFKELIKKANDLMRDRVDYQHLYYQPYIGGKYVRRHAQKISDELQFFTGHADDT